MRQVAFTLIACFVSQFWSAALAQEGSLTLPERLGDGVELSLKNRPAEQILPELLQIFVGSPGACCTNKTPMAGTYDLVDNTLTFAPAFEFIAGQTYTVRSHDDAEVLTAFVIAAENTLPAPEVLAIYPSGPVIPENTLRFYIEFSTPMMPHRAREFIKLLDANGKADTAAFMSFTQELWNADRTRLTLLMDPGRIKRGVAQNVALGPALLEGQHYSIVIEDGWPSALGGQKVSRFEHAFSVTQPLRSLPDVDLWRIKPPKQASSAPLIITFDRPFDQQLAQTAITVQDAGGARISGTVSLNAHEQTWRFSPDERWKTSHLQIVVETRLEDVSGNNFIDLLDHSLGTPSATTDQETITIAVKLLS